MYFTISLPKLSTRTRLTVLHRQNSSRHRFSSLLDFRLRQVHSALLTSLLCRTLISPVQLDRNLFLLRYFSLSGLPLPMHKVGGFQQAGSRA